jgi:hypothetical protein
MNDNTKILSNLYAYREKIEDSLAEIQAILMQNFPEEYHVASQHWIIQIKTALRNNLKYLPRGDYTMDYTLAHIEDKVLNKHNKGVHKYI